MNSRQKQALATKQKIVDVTKRLISESGYEHVTVDDIVAECGIAKGTFYHHFKSKDEVILYLSKNIYCELTEVVSQKPNLSFMEKLQYFINLWYQIVETYNLHFSQQYTNQYSSKLSHIDQGISLIKYYLEEGISSDELVSDTPVEPLAKGLMFTLQGSTLYHYKHEEAFDVLSWSDDFLKYILNPLILPYLNSKGN